MPNGRGFSIIALVCAVGAASLALLAGSAGATDLSGALVSSADCTQHQLDRNDDGSTGSVTLPFPIDFFGRRHEQLWVNNNGNVTFDGPLSTYTPFGLAGTSAVIIAPFFADVDTRAAGSDLVRYGWGETTYQGHRAFCVNWINVGYYSFHTDKLNSFQLLLVQREDSSPTDFDIVFNYGSVQWETGDASGGVGGFGGSPAHAGYSNGDGQAGTSFELAGSGRTGAFIDGHADFGLIDHSFGSTQPGRYVFPVRNGAALPDEYVAMGDSYQSGVGAGDYDPATDIGGTNECLRSPNAYAPRLVADRSIPLALDFVACSGARIEHLSQAGPVTNGPPWNEDAQISHLSERTALVTVGIGGNNLNFGPLLQDCITRHFIFSSCEDAYDDDVLDALIALLDHGPGGLNRLQDLYLDVRFRAWRGNWLVLGYPRFFGLDGGSDWWSSGLLVPRCNNIRVSDQLWVNHKVHQLNQAIRASAQSMGLRYVDIEDAPQGHELCEDDPGFLNGIVPTNLVESFHPSSYGHSVIADVLRGALPPFAGAGSGSGGGGGGGAGLTMAAAQEPEIFTVHPGETVSTTRTIAGGTQASFSTSWPGSDVVMTLRSPSGRVIERATSAADLHHRVGPTQELYLVTDPEPGTWTIELYGAQVQPTGEPTTLAVYETPRPNADPVARFTTVQTGRTLTLDARGSSDSDGQIVAYLWEFGDGTFGTGPTVTHTYAQPGTYRVTLVVADEDEGLGFAAGDQDIVVPRYEFGGFREPIENQPALNKRNPGSAIPVKFTLANAEGAGIFEAGFPQSQPIDCTTRAPLGAGEPMTREGEWTFQNLTAGVYHFKWKTSSPWRGTCRRLVLGFDDGSRAAADFWFK